ncbi:hypothetical protein ES705_12661 [subsurface metagenome]
MVYGKEINFTTLCIAPTAITNAATSLDNTTASSNGTVNTNGCNTEVIFQYGLTSSYGFEEFAIQNPVSGSGSTEVSAAITELKSGQTYHFRVKASSAGGTIYGSDLIFTTTINDKDGNEYTAVPIGTQVWMVENLKTTKYKDGTVIPLVTSNSSWISLSTPGYFWYNNDAVSYKNTFGALYNWYTVNTNELCPLGWHVPTDAEWTVLIDHLDGHEVAWC